MIAAYPSIVGSDVGGIVISVGSSVPTGLFKPGTRVTAMATAFYSKGAPDFGALQERVIIPASNVCPIPDSMSFNEACILPLAVSTAWAGWYTIGLPEEKIYGPSDKMGYLVWGAASSVGSAALQLAKLMGYTVYATASEKHHEYIKSLGASRVFDYKSPDAVAEIVKAAKEDGLTFNAGYSAISGTEPPSAEILKQLKGEGVIAKLACAARQGDDPWAFEGVEAKFIQAPQGEKDMTEHFRRAYNVWLKEKLEKGEFIPSPKIKIVEGGLESANKALDELKGGVSGVKLVLEV